VIESLMHQLTDEQLAAEPRARRDVRAVWSSRSR
jgi:hypothetical protein